MVLGSAEELNSGTNSSPWERECLGAFYIKSNYPGRCSHICTGNFLVNAGIRNKGIGRTLADCFLNWAPKLGYTYCLFNLVFETNLPARKIWESLNFKKLGKIKSAGILKGHDHPIDAFMYGRDLINIIDPDIGAYRFDKIKYYLETGNYPAMADRQEKSRLRASATHYNLENGKLMLKGKEVISNPQDQLKISQQYHYLNHSGINKTTTAIAETYHWTGIKDTVAQAVKSCPECRHHVKEKRKKDDNQDSRKIRKVYSNNDTRDLSVDAIVAAVQLHNLPRNDENLLAGLDDNLIAVVEEAQRKRNENRNDSHNRHENNHPSHQNHSHDSQNNHNNLHQNHYPSNNNNHYSQYDNFYNSAPKHQSNIPVDPEVENYSHPNPEENYSHPTGHEIEIAQALMQANRHVVNDDDDDDERKRDTNRDETNLFLSNEPKD